MTVVTLRALAASVSWSMLDCGSEAVKTLELEKTSPRSAGQRLADEPLGSSDELLGSSDEPLGSRPEALLFTESRVRTELP
jgi:hypothetical protein